MPGHGQDEPSESPTLPVWKAFLVQFGRDAGVTAGAFEGRVEHLSSGRRVHFGSRTELLTVLGSLLDEVAREPE